MQESREQNSGIRNWDLVVIAAFLAIDELRNAFLLFLANLDVWSLSLLLVVVWFLRSRKFNPDFGLGKMGLFDGFFGKYDAKN